MIQTLGIIAICCVVMLALFGFSYSTGDPNRRLRFTYYGLNVTAFILALYLSTFFEYQPSPTRRVIGAPIPTVVFVLENGQWVDFTGPGWFLNMIALTTLIPMPMTIGLILRGRRRDRLEQQQGFEVIQPLPEPMANEK